MLSYQTGYNPAPAAPKTSASTLSPQNHTSDASNCAFLSASAKKLVWLSEKVFARGKHKFKPVFRQQAVQPRTQTIAGERHIADYTAADTAAI